MQLEACRGFEVRGTHWAAFSRSSCQPSFCTVAQSAPPAWILPSGSLFYLPGLPHPQLTCPRSLLPAVSFFCLLHRLFAVKTYSLLIHSELGTFHDCFHPVSFPTTPPYCFYGFLQFLNPFLRLSLSPLSTFLFDATFSSFTLGVLFHI